MKEDKDNEIFSECIFSLLYLTILNEHYICINESNNIVFIFHFSPAVIHGFFSLLLSFISFQQTSLKKVEEPLCHLNNQIKNI